MDDPSVHSENGIWAVVPVKPFELAKQRLAKVLDPVEREQLMRCMVHDVIAALRASRGIEGILLVSRSPAVRNLARQLGVEHWQESDSADLSQAVSEASDWLLQQYSARGTLIIPGDVPLLTPSEIERLIACCGTGEPCLALVPDQQEEGTNAVLSSPPNLIPYRYDGTSFKPHHRAAQQQGLQPVTLHLTGIALDIDTPEDLQQLLQRLPPNREGIVTHKNPEKTQDASSLRIDRMGSDNVTGAFLASISLCDRLADYLSHRPGSSRKTHQPTPDIARRTG